MSRIIYLLVGITAILPLLSPAQDDFGRWKKQEEEKYRQFKEERDRDFAEFLKKEWRGMQLMRGVVPDEKPKPVSLPKYTPPPSPPRDTLKVRLPVEVLLPGPMPATPPDLGPPPPAGEKKGVLPVSIEFYDTSVPVTIEEGTRVAGLASVGKEGISGFWADLSRAPYEALLGEVWRARERLELNDWGFALFLHAVGRQGFGYPNNTATLFAWFMLSKSGYDARVGYSNDRIFLMLPTENKLYGVPYITSGKDGRRYYLLSPDPGVRAPLGELFTYDGSYAGAEKPCSFTIRNVPRLKEKGGVRTLKFSYGGKAYSFPVRFSSSAVKFFEYYPQTNFEVYFGAVPSAEAVASLLEDFRPLLRGKTEMEAVNLLLRFVQTAFGYKTDQEQFGREKPFFPDETLYYEYSDCEDRAILFAYLVRSLLELEVIGLDFPGHIATAVRFSSDFPGDAVVFEGKKYLVCDPTFINADAGACMPDFKGVAAGIIALRSR